jgi:type IV pilus assembly protein PilP
MSLLLLATAGCGDGPESEPVRQPPVLRKKITTPQEPQAGPEKADKAKPVMAPPEEEAAQQGAVSVQDAQKIPPKRKIVKAVPPPSAKVEPAPGEKRPPSPSAVEVPASASKPGEKATEGETAKAPPVQRPEVEPAAKEDEPSVLLEELAAEASIEGIITQSAYEYNPVGKIDPFQPLFQIEAEPEVTQKKVIKKKRLPLTPLQKISLGQLKVVGIIQSPTGNKALVEDASGKGFIVTKGTYIGQNFGQVKRILKDRIVVEEEVEDVLSGKTKLQTTELRLQKEAGDV